MMINPFAAPQNYPEMLNKIAFYTFFETLLFLAILANASSKVGALMNAVAIPVTLKWIDKIPIAYVVVAFIITVIARALKLHDKISTVFGIRERFDVHEILVPLAGGVGVPATLQFLDCAREKRHTLMYRVFYKYASSTNPKIDKHLITMALDKWSWFWIVIEFIVIGFISLLGLLFLDSVREAAWVATVLFVATLFATFINQMCASAAHRQVREILVEMTRRGEIKVAIDEICS